MGRPRAIPQESSRRAFAISYPVWAERLLDKGNSPEEAEAEMARQVAAREAENRARLCSICKANGDRPMREWGSQP